MMNIISDSESLQLQKGPQVLEKSDSLSESSDVNPEDCSEPQLSVIHEGW